MVETDENGYVTAVTVNSESDDGPWGTYGARNGTSTPSLPRTNGWGVIDLLRGGELEQTAWDHWYYGAPDTDQTNKTEMGALEITHEVALSNATEEATGRRTHAVPIRFTPSAKNEAGLSAVCGQLFCQQKAKKSCRLPEIYRKMLMQFTYA